MRKSMWSALAGLSYRGRRVFCLIVCCVATAFATIWWVSWPYRTWNSFALTLVARDDLRAMNSHCDTAVLRVIRIDEALYLRCRTSPKGLWLQWPLDSLYGGDMRAFRVQNGPLPSSIWEILAAKVPVTGSRAIGPGHLTFCRGSIIFELPP